MSATPILSPMTAALFLVTGCNAAFHFDVLPAADAGDGDAGSAADGAAAPDASSCANDARCAGLRCEVASGSCVECLADTDCSGARARCEPVSHTCVACLNRPDCGKRQGCDTVTNRCLDGCFDTDDPCPLPGFVCDGDVGLCIECKRSANCAGSAGGPLCDVPIGRCVACTGNAQCPAAKPACDRRTGRCEACVVAATCGDGAVCDPITLTCRRAS